MAAGDATDARDHVEIEWQFAAPDLAAVERAAHDAATTTGLTLRATGERELTDRYLDTDDWAIHRTGYTLRLRSDGSRSEATLKSMGEAAEGPRKRRERNDPLVSADLLALLTADGPVAQAVRAVAGRCALRPLFEVHTRRRVLVVANSDRDVGELALDHSTIDLPGAGPLRVLQRVEVEAADANAAITVEPFVDALRSAAGLVPVDLSKFASGLAAVGLDPAPALDLGPTDYRPTSAIADVAYTVMRGHWHAYLDNEPGTRLGEDPEALHDMRVASRRLRVALTVFGPYLPETLASMRDELRWVAGVLGDVRDLDVQLEWLEAHATVGSVADPAAIEPLRGLLAARRGEARCNMLVALDSSRHASLVEEMTAQLTAGESPPEGRVAALEVAPRLLERGARRLHRAAEELGPGAPPQAYHQTRIRAKQLRYTTEFCTGLYGAPAADLVAALKQVQDELGRRQDAAVAIERLRTLADPEAGLPTATVFAMGALAEGERQTMIGLADEFGARYQLVRERWRTLRALFDDASA